MKAAHIVGLAIPAVLVAVLGQAGHLSAKDPVPTPAEEGMMGEVDAYLLRTLYKSPDADAGLASIAKSPEFKALVAKYGLKLFGGPMLGCVTDTSAKVWVRTSGAAEVKVVFSTNKDFGKGMQCPAAETRASDDFTAVIELSGLKPSTTYYYDVLVDGESACKAGDVHGRAAPSFRTFPAPGEKAKFEIGFGGGARYVPKHERIWDTIASRRPAAFLFLGDNVYIDKPLLRNTQRVHYYRRQLRPEYRRFAASTGIYAIYDDHDFGKNDCAGGLHPTLPEWKVPVWRVFKENWVNPYYGGGEKVYGCWFDFRVGDVQVFMLDNRYYRDFKKGEMLGPVQQKWLLEKLAASKAKFKVLASPTLWTELADKGGKDSWWGVPRKREEIFSLIDRRKIPGVILISADRHRTDVYRIARPDGYDLWEFETSKLTNMHTHGTRKQAEFSYNKGNFYGVLSFDLTLDDPTVTFRCITIEGKEVYAKCLKLSELGGK